MDADRIGRTSAIMSGEAIQIIAIGNDRRGASSLGNAAWDTLKPLGVGKDDPPSATFDASAPSLDSLGA